MALKPWKILSSKHVYPSVRIDQCELPDGQLIEGFVLEYHDWATVVALTPDNQVVMERQYRHGIQKVLLELPGGVIDDSDASPLEAARRELLEETGYTSEKFIQVGKVYPNPANQVNSIHYYLALDAYKSAPQHLDGTEEIEVELLPLDDLIELAKRGELVQSLQVSALFFALAYLNRIK
jgi:8-oxo-dGTP pyrophosphatase MutT (NUDIX family)